MTGYTFPVVGFCAFSGTGKTTLLKNLLPLLKRRGLRIGVVKHAHHRFEIDHPIHVHVAVAFVMFDHGHRRIRGDSPDQTFPAAGNGDVNQLVQF